MKHEGLLDLHTGSPEVAGWTRLCTVLMDSKGTAYMG